VAANRAAKTSPDRSKLRKMGKGPASTGLFLCCAGKERTAVARVFEFDHS
jgi:hypothetical protein